MTIAEHLDAFEEDQPDLRAHAAILVDRQFVVE